MIIFVLAILSLTKTLAQINITSYDHLNFDKSEFENLNTLVKDKRVICLGESEHRIESPNHLRYMTIKYLHEKMGYNVVIFESPISSVFASNRLNLIDTIFLKNAIFGVWNTNVVKDFINYSKSNNIAIHGCDVQGIGSNFSFSKELLKFCYNLKIENSLEFYKTDSLIEQAYIDIVNRGEYFGRNKNDNQNIVWKNTCHLLIKILKEKQLSDSGKQIDFDYWIQCIRNRAYLADLVYESDWKKFTKYRDEIMAENLRYLIYDKYKNEKIIVWAHDFHISKDYYSKSYKNIGFKSMIQCLDDKQKDIYSISIRPVKWYSSIRTQKQLKKYEFTLCPSNNRQYDAIFYTRQWEKAKILKIK